MEAYIRINAVSCSHRLIRNNLENARVVGGLILFCLTFLVVSDQAEFVFHFYVIHF